MTNLKRTKSAIFRFVRRPRLLGLAFVIVTILFELYSHKFNAREIRSTAVRVSDGDTIVMNDTSGKKRIRLKGIDAPEIKQVCTAYENGQIKQYLCGEEAKKHLAQMINGYQVECTNEGQDKYNRQLSYCYANGKDLNKAMVRDGYAIAYTSFDLSFIPDECLARFEKAGLWRGEFENPAEWRKRNALEKRDR